jgi:hypothetical protein
MSLPAAQSAVLGAVEPQDIGRASGACDGLALAAGLAGSALGGRRTGTTVTTAQAPPSPVLEVRT